MSKSAWATIILMSGLLGCSAAEQETPTQAIQEIVRTYESQDLGQDLNPFILLDYAGPADFPPTEDRLGVGEHPHRGFETVTIVYSGEVEHRDSSGGGGSIGPGDVQWMTAASGVVHEEFHGRNFAAQGGSFEMVQLWVNLPAKDKMSAPGYQNILDASIPRVGFPDDKGGVRVIAGAYEGAKGPARTFTPLNVWDLDLRSSEAVKLAVPAGHLAAIVVLRGSLRVNGTQELGEAELAAFTTRGNTIEVDQADNTTALLLSGVPIEEPMVAQGPFVMNTAQEISQAMADYQNGRMGKL